MQIQSLFIMLTTLTMTFDSGKILAEDEQAPRSVKSRVKMFEQMNKQEGNVLPVRKPNMGQPAPKPEPAPETAFRKAAKPILMPKHNLSLGKPRVTSEPTSKNTSSEKKPERSQSTSQENPPISESKSAAVTHNCSQCSKQNCQDNKGRYEFCRYCADVDIEPCREGAIKAGFVDTKADFQKLMALSEAKGLKVKDVLPQFEKMGLIMNVLHNKIGMLKKKDQFLKIEETISESINSTKNKLGLNNRKIDPEKELKNYDHPMTTSIIGGMRMLSVGVCQALVNELDASQSGSFFSQINRLIKPKAKNKQKTLIHNMKKECESWESKIQQGTLEKKEVLDVLQELWKGMDTQLEAARRLLKSHNK